MKKDGLCPYVSHRNDVLTVCQKVMKLDGEIMLLDATSPFYFPSINKNSMAPMRTGEFGAMWEPVHVSIMVCIFCNYPSFLKVECK